WQRLMQRGAKWTLRDPRAAATIRQNLGTIIDTETLKVRLKNRMGGTPLGEVEESFAATLTPGDTFLIGGQIVRYETIRELTVEVTRSPGHNPKVAVFNGTKFATSTLLADRVLRIFQQHAWPNLPHHTAEWLAIQREVSQLPEPGRLLLETFPHESREHLVIYGFAGRNAQQTLGLLVTKRMEDEGLAPLGFVATDYATMIWGLEPVLNPLTLLSPENLREGLENWLGGNAVMKRTFRNAATTAMLIERQNQGRRKSGRQAVFSSDILYDTLRRFDPDHLLLQITQAEAMRGMVDFGRIEDMLTRIETPTTSRIDIRHLRHVSPLAFPMFLERGRVPVDGKAMERLLADEAAKLMAAAGLSVTY
ncbi:MAG: DNA ligase-associated DEXH box helicase, partial [Pseudorhodobacter sp.]|nr:DNA ligase-associated DEXH box helicase [Pseudorhodobacter sp.]